MIKISILKNQSTFEIEEISNVFLTTGMSQDEADYYAGQIGEGVEFEIDAPENDTVFKMIASLRALDVRLESVVVGTDGAMK